MRDQNILGSSSNERIFIYNLILLRKRSGHSAKWIDNVLKLFFQDMNVEEMDIRIRVILDKHTRLALETVA